MNLSVHSINLYLTFLEKFRAVTALPDYYIENLVKKIVPEYCNHC